jgi:hypothetical protein
MKLGCRISKTNEIIAIVQYREEPWGPKFCIPKLLTANVAGPPIIVS